MQGVKDTITHGTSGYRNLRCKCEICRAAHAAQQRQWRARAAGREVPRPNGRPPSPCCRRGHIIAEVGRYSNGACRECQKLMSRNYELKVNGLDPVPLDDGPSLGSIHLDPTPLVKWAEPLWDRMEPQTRDYLRCLKNEPKRKISVERADEICVANKTTLLYVYGKAWFE